MERPSDYRFTSMDRLIDVVTLSPSSEYFYRLKAPKELNKSAFGCRIAFFKVSNGELIYHRRATYAHELHSRRNIDELRNKMSEHQFKGNDYESLSLQMVHWSADGTVVYFLEYQNTLQKRLFESVILDLQRQSCYRINEFVDDFEKIEALRLDQGAFDGKEVLQKLDRLNIQRKPCFKQSWKLPFLNTSAFFSRNWYP